MNLLRDILPPANIRTDVEVRARKPLFEMAATLFAESMRGIDASAIVENLLARERLGSTGLGQGVAVPHARISGLSEPLGAFLRLATPLPFEAPDAVPVSLVFVLLVPEQATERHLQILAQIAEMLSDGQVREQLQTAADALAVRRLFTSWEPQLR